MKPAQTKPRTISIWRLLLAVFLLLFGITAILDANNFMDGIFIFSTTGLGWMTCALWFAFEYEQDNRRRERWLGSIVMYGSMTVFFGFGYLEHVYPDLPLGVRMIKFIVTIIFIRSVFFGTKSTRTLLSNLVIGESWRFWLFQPPVNHQSPEDITQ